MKISTNEQVRNGLDELQSSIRVLVDSFYNQYGYYPSIKVVEIIAPSRVACVPDKVMNVLIKCNVEI